MCLGACAHVCVLFFHVLQSLVFLLLPWKDERPPSPPLAASGCQALLSAAARGCLSQGSAFQNNPGAEEPERAAGSISPRTLLLQREADRLSCSGPGWSCPVLREPLTGTSSPALPARGGRASRAHLGQVSLGPWAAWFVFMQYL